MEETKKFEQMQKLVERLQERKYNTKKRIEELKELDEWLRNLEGIETIPSLLAPLGRVFDDSSDKYYLGIWEGKFDLWYDYGLGEYKESKYYPYDFLEENLVPLKVLVNCYVEIIERLLKIGVNEKSIWQLIDEKLKEKEVKNEK